MSTSHPAVSPAEIDQSEPLQADARQERRIERSASSEAQPFYDCQVKVGVRIRPLASTETSQGGKTVVYANDIHRTISIGKKQERTFTYDMVFDSNVTQTQLYDRLKGQLLGAFLDGYNATIMAYGQTGSGKSYTMGSDSQPNSILEESDMRDAVRPVRELTTMEEKKEQFTEGADSSNSGLIPQFMCDIFGALEQMSSANNSEDGASGSRSSYQLTASFIEVYGEDVYDLLDRSVSPNGRKSLPIREDSSGTVMVVGLMQIPIHTVNDALAVLREGTRHRTTAATLMNQCSSRSHAVFTIWLQCTFVTGNSKTTASSSESSSLDVTTSSRLTFVDLAGSERMKKTGAEGERAREGIKINEGLLALGNVINALADEERLSKGAKPIHVPYRQSKLTRLLQDALGGNSQTLFLACVSPSDTNVSETLSTLQYANRARNIKNAPTKNVDGTMLELQRLNALTNVLQSELIKHRFGYHFRSSLLPMRLEEEEQDLSDRAPVLADDFDVDDLLQRQDVQEYLREIYQKAIEQQSLLQPSTFDFTAAAAAVSSIVTTNNSTAIPPLPRSSSCIPALQMQSNHAFASAALTSVPHQTAVVNREPAQSSAVLRRSSMQPSSSINDDFETTALLEVNPDEDMAILDQLLELQQHDQEYNTAQKEDQKKLTEVEGELKQQEELLLQLRQSLKVYHDMKDRYEALVAEVQSLEAEKTSLADQLERALQDPAKGCSVAIQKKLEKVEQSLSRARNETRKHQQLYRKAEQEAQKCRVLEWKISELKQGKVTLIRKQREAATKHKEFTEAKTREIQALKTRERKTERQLSKLEMECRQHKTNLERRKTYCDKLSSKLKETESHLMKLLTMRKKELQERTRKIQPSSRASMGFSSSGGTPYKSLRADERMCPPMMTEEEKDEDRIFAPLNDETSTVIFLLKRQISDKVAMAHGKKRYEERVAEYSKLMRALMEEVKTLNELREEEETESTSEEIQEREQNVEDLELRIELISSNLEDLRSRLELGSSPDTVEFDDTYDYLQTNKAEAHLISTCPAPVARTALWEIARALSDSELEIRVLEESTQRKDAAIRGLEQEIDMLTRQLSSISRDYKELRKLRADRGEELDNSFRQKELHKELSSLKIELEQKSQQEQTMAASLEQMKHRLDDRERELAISRERTAVLAAAERSKNEHAVANDLLTKLQSIWGELGVSFESRDIARGKIERCLEDTCSRMLEEAMALRNDTHNRIDEVKKRLVAVVSALGINDCDLDHGTGLEDKGISVLQKLDDFERKLRKYQPRYDAAKERRDKLAEDVKKILQAMDSLEDGLSSNLRKLLNDYERDQVREQNASLRVHATNGDPDKPKASKKSVSGASAMDEKEPIADDDNADVRCHELELAAEEKNDETVEENSLSEAFLDACEGDTKTLRSRKREFLIANNELRDKTRVLVEEMYLSSKDMLSICTRMAKKRFKQLPNWWHSAAAISVCEALGRKETVVGVSDLYTKHLRLISELLQIISVGRKVFADTLKLVVENAHNVLLATLEDDVDAKEAYSSFHEALFRLPKMSKDHIQACIDEISVLVNAAEAVAQSETEALIVVWEALDVSLSERELFWAAVEEQITRVKTRTDSPFDAVLSVGAAELEEWTLMAVKDAIKSNRLLDLKLFKLQKIHAEVEEKRGKQDLKSKIISMDSEIRMISAKLADFEEKAGTKQRLVTKKMNSSNFLKEERFRKHVQSKFASKLEGLGNLLQEWQRKEGSTFDPNVLSEDVRALVVNLAGFDAWVEQRTAFMHLKTVKPKVSARKGVGKDTEACTPDDGSSVVPDLEMLPQPPPLARSRLWRSSSVQESGGGATLGAVSSLSRGTASSSRKPISESSSGSRASSISRKPAISPSSLQTAIKNGPSERDASKSTERPRDLRRIHTAASSANRAAPYCSTFTPAKSRTSNTGFHNRRMENRSPHSIKSTSRTSSPASRAPVTPKRIVIGTSAPASNPFGHVLTHENT